MGQKFSYRRLMIIGGLGAWTDCMDEMVIAITMPVIAVVLGLSMPEIGALLGGMYLGYMIAGFIAGPFIDYFGRKIGFVTGNFFAGLCYLIYVVFPIFPIFFAVRIISGFSAALSTVSYYTWLPEEVPAERRTTLVGLSEAMALLGGINYSILAMLMGAGIVTWQFIYIYVCVFDFFVAFLAAVLLKESSLWLERQRLIEEGKIPKSEKVPIRKFLSKEIRGKFLCAFLVAIAGWFGLVFVALPFINTFESTVLGWSMFLIGLMEITDTACAGISRVVWGRVGDRFGRLNTLIMAGTLCILGANIFFRTPILIGIGELLPVIVFFMLWRYVFTWGFNGTSAIQRVWFGELVPTGIRGSMESFNMIIASLISFLSSVIVGFLAGIVGFIAAVTIPPTLGGIILIVVPLVAKKLGFETKGKVLEI